jgi:hypothetical protein
MTRRLTLVALASTALVSLAGCSDDDDEDGARRAATQYAIDVERVSDDADRASQQALVTLNKVADDSIASGEAIDALEANSERIARESKALGELMPPEPAAQTADDLAGQLDALARDLSFAATDVRVAEKGEGDLATAGRSNARVVLASSSSASALSRALRALAVESAD